MMAQHRAIFRDHTSETVIRADSVWFAAIKGDRMALKSWLVPLRGRVTEAFRKYAANVFFNLSPRNLYLGLGAQGLSCSRCPRTKVYWCFQSLDNVYTQFIINLRIGLPRSPSV